MNIVDYKDLQRRTFKHCVGLSVKKGHDYSGTGDDTFRNIRAVESYGMSAEEGLIPRLSDKQSRIANLILNGSDVAVIGETLFDTICDNINYLTILTAILVEKGKLKLPEEAET